MKSYATEQPWLPFSETLLDWDEGFHQLMLNDTLRTSAYRDAIRAAIRPGDVVMDIGTGTGILSQWALEAGAAHVYGVELNKNILEMATQRLARNGYEEQFHPINLLSFDVHLETRVDVLLSEIIGNLADNEDFQPILQDAIRRFMKPGGIAVPLAVTSYLAPVAAPEAHRRIRNRDIAVLNPKYRETVLCRRLATGNPFNTYYDAILPSNGLLGKPQIVQHFHGQWEQPREYAVDLRFIACDPGLLTGFKGHFVAHLTKQVILDISADEIASGWTSDSWKHAYLPIENPLPVERGDCISLRFSRKYRCDGVKNATFQQLYAWEGSVERGSRLIGRFHQSMELLYGTSASSELARALDS